MQDLHRERARVHFLERDLPCRRDARADEIVERRGARAAVELHIELEVETQAAGISVGRADERPLPVDDQQLAVVERQVK